MSPLELVSLIANQASSFDFDITVDKFDGGRYVVGEPIRVRGVSQEGGWMSLLYIDSAGGVGIALPAGGKRRSRSGPASVPHGPLHSGGSAWERTASRPW